MDRVGVLKATYAKTNLFLAKETVCETVHCFVSDSDESKQRRSQSVSNRRKLRVKNSFRFIRVTIQTDE
ncbi:hypothetical protein C0J52_27322 [Blattella germanica]|nr:hypothetical protein C0J52_27322 [Blattella germanica]